MLVSMHQMTSMTWFLQVFWKSLYNSENTSYDKSTQEEWPAFLRILGKRTQYQIPGESFINEFLWRQPSIPCRISWDEVLGSSFPPARDLPLPGGCPGFAANLVKRRTGPKTCGWLFDGSSSDDFSAPTHSITSNLLLIHWWTQSLTSSGCFGIRRRKCLVKGWMIGLENTSPEWRRDFEGESKGRGNSRQNASEQSGESDFDRSDCVSMTSAHWLSSGRNDSSLPDGYMKHLEFRPLSFFPSSWKPGRFDRWRGGLSFGARW